VDEKKPAKQVFVCVTIANLIHAGLIRLEKPFLRLSQQLWTASNCKDDRLGPATMPNTNIHSRLKICRQQRLCYQTITVYTTQ